MMSLKTLDRRRPSAPSRDRRARPASTPSPICQKIQKRFHSLYDGTCAYSQRRPGVDRVVVVGGRAEPRRRALEHEQLADARRDLGDELHRARAGADHRDPLAARGRRRGPTARSGTPRPANESRPAMSGKRGRLSWPTALIDRVRRRSSPRVPSASRTRTVHVRVVVGPRRRRAPRCRTGCARAGRTRRRSGGSSRAARPGSRSAAASRGAARTSSCSCGSGCRPGSRDSVFSSHVPPTSSFFSTITKATPACCSRCAASRPDMPAPMISDAEVDVGRDVGLAPVGRAPVLAAERELLLEQRQVRRPCRRRRRPRTP